MTSLRRRRSRSTTKTASNDGEKSASDKYRGKDGVLRNRKGGVVDCNSCGGNHFERDCPELKEIVEDTLKASGKKTEQALVTVEKVMAAVEDFDQNE